MEEKSFKEAAAILLEKSEKSQSGSCLAVLRGSKDILVCLSGNDNPQTCIGRYRGSASDEEFRRFIAPLVFGSDHIAAESGLPLKAVRSFIEGVLAARGHSKYS